MKKCKSLSARSHSSCPIDIWWCQHSSLRTSWASCRKDSKIISRISCCCYVIRGRGNFWREKLFWRVPPGIDIWRAFSLFLFNWRNFYILLKKMTSSYRFCEESWLKMCRSPPSRKLGLQTVTARQVTKARKFSGIKFLQKFCGDNVGK